MEVNGFPNTQAGGRAADPSPSKEKIEMSYSFHNLSYFTGILINKLIVHNVDSILYMINSEFMFLVDGLGVLCNSPEVLKHVCVQCSGHLNKDSLLR